jgi:hypothetical protein
MLGAKVAKMAKMASVVWRSSGNGDSVGRHKALGPVSRLVAVAMDSRMDGAAGSKGKGAWLGVGRRRRRAGIGAPP